MRKKILFLSAAPAHILPLEYAREQGHYVITYDYLTENPRQKLAYEWHNFNTIDRDQSTELNPNACMTAKDKVLCEGQERPGMCRTQLRESVITQS